LIAALGSLLSDSHDLFGFALAWGISISFVAMVQMVVALNLERGYDRTIIRPLFLGAAYPLGYWILAATAALQAERSRSCGDARGTGRLEHPTRAARAALAPCPSLGSMWEPRLGIRDQQDRRVRAL
jgi:hypothetical protein